MNNMTPTQQKTYNYILSFEKKYGYVPSTRNIEKHFKVSFQSVQQTINQLVAKNYLQKVKPEPKGHYKVIHTPVVQK